jgi:hypothetical protein
VQGNIYRLKNLGAWPTHLAVTSLLVNLADSSEGVRIDQVGIERAFQPAVDMLLRWRDQLAYGLDLPPWVKWLERPQQRRPRPAREPSAAWRAPRVVDCLVKPHTGGDPELRPTLAPVVQDAVLTQDLHGCNYELPGLDISSTSDRASPLQAPMPGEVRTYTDRWQNTTIQIENDEWIVTMLHPRSYVVRRGQVLEGRLVGVMGAQGRATGPHVHFAIYDKISKGYVDPGAFIPALPQLD